MIKSVFRRILLVALIWINAGCGHDGDVWFVLPEDLPPCIVDIAFRKTEEPFGFLAEFIVRYKHNGEDVYYISPSCADCFGYFLDAECQYICSPEFGRIICSDSFNYTDSQLIWCISQEVCNYSGYFR